jgi:hypothetical protein
MIKSTIWRRVRISSKEELYDYMHQRRRFEIENRITLDGSPITSGDPARDFRMMCILSRESARGCIKIAYC